MPAPSLIVYGDRMLNQHFDGTRGCAIDLGVGVLKWVKSLPRLKHKVLNYPVVMFVV